jgi:hypothetical protein
MIVANDIMERVSSDGRAKLWQMHIRKGDSPICCGGLVTA